jgi:methyl-accepting chemotaxis protein
MEQAEDRAQSPAWAAESLQAYTEALSQTLGALDTAQTAVTAQPVDAALLKTDLANYREQLIKLKQAQLNIETVQNRFEQQLDELREHSHRLSEGQTAKRDSEAEQTHRLLICVTLVALLLGVLAAWWITRQIVGPLRTLLTAR